MDLWLNRMRWILAALGIVVIFSGVFAYPAGYGLPVAGRVRITAGPSAQDDDYHTGHSAEAMDFQALDRSSFPVYAVASGKAYFFPSGNSGGFGDLIIIQHDNGLFSFYAHLSTVLVSGGQQVKAGDHIGDTGNTGHGAGNHLHFEIRSDMAFRNGVLAINSGTPVKIVDNPNIDYVSGQPCCSRGFADGAQTSNSSGNGSACLTINVTSANLRSGPSTGYAVVGSVQHGEQLPITGQNASSGSTWYQVTRSNGQTAWISSTIVALCPSNGQIPTVNVAAPPSQPSTSGVLVDRNDHIYKNSSVCVCGGGVQQFSTPSQNVTISVRFTNPISVCPVVVLIPAVTGIDNNGNTSDPPLFMDWINVGVQNYTATARLPAAGKYFIAVGTTATEACGPYDLYYRLILTAGG